MTRVLAALAAMLLAAVAVLVPASPAVAGECTKILGIKVLCGKAKVVDASDHRVRFLHDLGSVTGWKAVPAGHNSKTYGTDWDDTDAARWTSAKQRELGWTLCYLGPHGYAKVTKHQTRVVEKPNGTKVRVFKIYNLPPGVYDKFKMMDDGC